jgi:Amt family ammonium transporter
MQSFILIGVISLEWILIGYSMSFGPDKWGIIGGLEWFALNGVGSVPNADYAATIPHNVFMIFQCMFAVITPALITGAFAERMKFGPFVLFSLLWAILVYNPLCHWIWGGGWMADLGAKDFAGGVAVHLASGAAALVAAIMLGKRRGYGSDELRPHNLPMTLLGAGILWFGWFGFNAGSALAVGAVAGNAFVATHIAGTTGALAWIVMEWKTVGKATTLGAASGAVAGLATVTPASGFVGPISASIIGILAGVLCYFGIMAKNRFGYDDSLDVVGIHGVGGVLGLLATGLFACTAVNPDGPNGLFFGNPALLGKQAIVIGATIVYTIVVTYILFKIIDKLFGLRVTEEDEISGLDLSQHDETAYN